MGSTDDRDVRLAELQAENERLKHALRSAAPDADQKPFDAIADSIDQMIWSTQPDGFHDYFNKRWYDYTGVPEGTTDGEGWNDMFHPDDQARAWDTWRRCLETGEPYQIEYRLRHRSGEYRWVLGRARPLRDANGTILRWYGTCTDIHELKVARDRLRESEARASQVLDAISEGFVLLSPDLVILDINPEGERIDGRPRAELIGRSVLEVWPESEDLPALSAYRAALSEQRPQGLEYRHVSDQHDVWLDVRIYPVEAGLAVFYRDISVRKRAEADAEAARETAQILAAEQSAILGQLAEGVIVTDAGGRITFVNDAAERLHGVRLLGVAPDAYAETYHLLTEAGAPYPPQDLPLARAVLKGETVEDVRWRIARPDGTEVLAIGSARPLRLSSGELVGAVLTVRDDTERRAAEARLRESEAQLRALTDNLPMAMVYQVVTSRDLSQRRFVYVSANCEPLLGIPAEAATSDPAALYQLVVAEEVEGLVAAEDAAAASLSTLDIEIGIRHRDGRLLRTRIVSRPRVLGDDRLIWDGILIDVTERKQAQDVAERTAALLGAIGDATLDNIYAKDREGRFLYANAATGRTLGHNPAALIGLTNAQVTRDAAEAEAITSNDQRIMTAGRTEVLEEVLTASDGTKHYYRSAKAPMLDAAGQVIGLAGVSADVTDQKSAQMALEEESGALETLNRTGAALAAELDLERLVQMVTDAGVELTAAHFGAFFYNVENEAGESLMLFTLSGAERSQFDFGMPRATAIFSPTFNGEGVIRSDDILTDRRYGLSGPHHGMPKGHLPVRSYLAVPVTSRSGTVIGGLFFGHPEPGRFTERHERLLVGIASQAAIGIDNARLYQAAQRELEERMRAEERLRELNGTLEERVTQEIAARTVAEDALRQAQKMETLGQLTGGVAHDFNNLLQIVTGNLEILRRNLPEGEVRLRRSAESAMRGAERAAILTQRLLAFARRQPLEPKALNLNKLVGGMSELLHRTIGEAVEIETVLASGLWTAEVDPNQLENAIINLAINARDAMPSGGKLTIETSNTHLDQAYSTQHTGVAAGQYVVICVSDTGTGMEAETVERVFEPFFTTKDVGRGTGLGLSMVYGFIKQSGGHVKIYSEPGQGTTVKLYFPRMMGNIAEEAEGQQGVAPEGTYDETILVCEDDDDVRAYSVEVLRELGYRVLEAHDGPSALRLLERQEGRVDLLFTDVVLPSGMMGNQLAEQARAVRPGLKVLFTTGYARNAIVHHGRLDAGVELITKPFSYADLAARIRDLLDAPA